MITNSLSAAILHGCCSIFHDFTLLYILSEGGLGGLLKGFSAGFTLAIHVLLTMWTIRDLVGL